MFSTTFNQFKKTMDKAMDAKVYPLNEKIDAYIMNFDGASKGNPGLSGAGAVIYKNGEEIWSSCKFIGTKTNNQSEYSALILGLNGALTLGITKLSVLGDSLLVINQVNGIYRVKSDSLVELYEKVLQLKCHFVSIEFNHVYRDYNKRADELSNLALEQSDFIKELDEDWGENVKEINLDRIVSPLSLPLFVKIPSANTKTKTKKNTRDKDKQLQITQFFKIGSLFPDI
jgi:ribonuclease HI